MTSRITYQAENLSCERNSRTLFQAIDFSLTSGQLLHITGANGCGKTTLLRMLGGLLPISTGQVHWCGEPLYIASDEGGAGATSAIREAFRCALIYIGDRAGINRALTAVETLKLMAELRGQQPQTTISKALEQLGLAPAANTFTEQLSAGQQRRLSLAQLIIFPAKLWILDEPFTALDKTGVSELQDLFDQHLAQGGMIILSSHAELALRHTAQQHLALDACP